MTGWLDDLRDIAPRGPLAMISVLASEGSVPRGPGTHMLVTASGQHGTVGGGALEWRAIEQARAILAHPAGTWRVQDYPLGPLLGQCCGGRVRLLVEHVDPARLGWLSAAREGAVLVTLFGKDGIERRIDDGARPAVPSAQGAKPTAGDSFAEAIGLHRRPVWLFGAGHVGQAIVRLGAGLPLRFAWFDTRPSFESVAGVAVVEDGAIERCVEEAGEDAAIVILTHDHGLDYRLTRAALSHLPTAFVGLIGSATKRARFLSRLERDGIGAEARARLTCPIGVAGVRGKEPDVIAIAVLAQLLQL